MKKILFLLTFFALNFYFSQVNHVLKLKFNEQYFLSNFITHKTNNAFVLKVFKITDSLSELHKNEDYIIILDSIMKSQSNLSEKEKIALTKFQKKEFDSLKIEIDNDGFLKLMKNAVEANFGLEFLKKMLNDSGVRVIKSLKRNTISLQLISIVKKV